MPHKIAIIGAGIMGSAIATRLLGGGHGLGPRDSWTENNADRIGSPANLGLECYR